MNDVGSATVERGAAAPKGVLRHALPKLLLMPFLLAFLLFVPAGRLDLVGHWAYLLVYVTFGAVNVVIIWRTDPTLLDERTRTGPGDRTPYFRLLIVGVVAVHFVVAGLDAGRYHWSGEFPPGLQLAGLAGLAISTAGWGWAIRHNRFFSGQVRIQPERGHAVVTGGPYRFVRHPGYAAMLLLLASSPLALGSYWSALALAPGVALFIYRAAVEDRMLMAELAGYAEYAANVRFRILPGVW